jgi:hypothetical protein
MEYEAGHFDKCHNTSEELWMCSQTLTQHSSQVSPSMCPLPPFLGYLKDQHMSLNDFKLLAAATLMNCLYISLCIYYPYTSPCCIFPAKASPNGPETRRDEHLPDQNFQFLFCPPRRSSIPNKSSHGSSFSSQKLLSDRSILSERLTSGLMDVGSGVWSL